MNDRALARYKHLIGGYRTRTAAGLVVAWNNVDRYNDEGVEQFTRRTEPLLAGAKAAAVAASASFFAITLRLPPVSVSAADVDVEPDVRAPFLAAWHALKVGRPFDEALGVGRSVAEAVGFDFVQSAARRTGDVVAERSDRQVRWRRTPGGSACSWCRTVAGQTYHSAESADFGHERCDCDAVPA